MSFDHSPGRGLRRFDEQAAVATQLSNAFQGLDEGVTPSAVLSALKRAGPYLEIPLRVVALVDLLFAWTKPQDWRGGSLPVVWPSNELLGQKLGVGVRQVQKLLIQTQAAGLISFLDSPNGHRGGRRAEDGSIVWGYGIVLAPVGTRHNELIARAVRGAADDKAVMVLRKRLAASRRKIRAIAQSALDLAIPDIAADEELALALMATAQMRGERDRGLLSNCVEQMEARALALTDRFAICLGIESAGCAEPISSCSGVIDDMHSTTTKQRQSAKADTGNGLAKKRSPNVTIPAQSQHAAIQANLEKYGVTPALIRETTPDLYLSMPNAPASWGELTAAAERAAAQSGISASAFHEALHVMGARGAAASVFATVQKYYRGDVRKPGAYLRGMTSRAAAGELDIGRTYHALKDTRRSVTLTASASVSDALPIGQLVSRLLAERRQ